MIQFKEPSSQKKKLRFWIGALVFFCILGAITNGWNGIIFAFLIGLIVILIFIAVTEIFEKQFDGWKINKDSLILIRVSLLGKREEQPLLFNEVNSILYVKPAARRPLSFKFITEKGAYWLHPTIDIYEFGATLKFLKSQGIEIDFLEGDYEIQLFLDDKIESIPLTNDMKITNKSIVTTCVLQYNELD